MEKLIDYDEATSERIYIEDVKKEIRLLYHLTVIDINATKDRQLKILNYIILLYVGIYGIWEILSSNPDANKFITFWGLIFLSSATYVVGISMNIIEQRLLDR